MSSNLHMSLCIYPKLVFSFQQILLFFGPKIDFLIFFVILVLIWLILLIFWKNSPILSMSQIQKIK
jgi:hypothetical protein